MSSVLTYQKRLGQVGEILDFSRGRVAGELVGGGQLGGPGQRKASPHPGPHTGYEQTLLPDLLQGPKSLGGRLLHPSVRPSPPSLTSSPNRLHRSGRTSPPSLTLPISPMHQCLTFGCKLPFCLCETHTF